MNSVFSLGCEIPGGDVSYIALDSEQSLLDAEIVVFEPSIESIIRGYSFIQRLNIYRGKTSLNEDQSFEIRSMVKHWKRELFDFVVAGGIAFINLCELQELYIRTGEKEYSGTGHNRHTTRIVESFCNYEFIPVRIKVKAAIGTSMTVKYSDCCFEEYWEQFGNESTYKVYLEDANSTTPIVYTARGNRIVGSIFRHKSGGAFVLLPWVNFDRKEFIDTEKKAHASGRVETVACWSSTARDWGKKYIETIQSISNSIKAPIQGTVSPEWAQDNAFRNRREFDLKNQLNEINESIETLREKARELEGHIESSCWPKYLLFGNGHALEQAVIKSMKLLGFQAERYQSAQSEFDVVLEYDGQRFIGEVEGRDNKSIGITKMRQLAMNLKEDLQRDDVTVQARGILFGNAHRLTRPSDRPKECFTRKCLDTAELDGTILIRTCDLFVVANYLSCTEDSRFAAACRDSIIRSNGSEVEFPSIESQERE